MLMCCCLQQFKKDYFSTNDLASGAKGFFTLHVLATNKSVRLANNILCKNANSFACFHAPSLLASDKMKENKVMFTRLVY